MAKLVVIELGGRIGAKLGTEVVGADAALDLFDQLVVGVVRVGGGASALAWVGDGERIAPAVYSLFDEVLASRLGDKDMKELMPETPLLARCFRHCS